MPDATMKAMVLERAQAPLVRRELPLQEPQLNLVN
jgi:hypothetical protein